MNITEIARFKLSAISRDEVIDAYKLFAVLLARADPDVETHISYHANAATWQRVGKATDFPFIYPELDLTPLRLMGCPIVVDPNYADSIFAVIYTEPETKDQFVLTLEFPAPAAVVGVPPAQFQA